MKPYPRYCKDRKAAWGGTCVVGYNLYKKTRRGESTIKCLPASPLGDKQATGNTGGLPDESWGGEVAWEERGMASGVSERLFPTRPRSTFKMLNTVDEWSIQKLNKQNLRFRNSLLESVKGINPEPRAALSAGHPLTLEQQKAWGVPHFSRPFIPWP